jgi:isopenicillin-N epimerase
VVSWGWESDLPGPSKFIDYFEWTGTHDISAYLSVPEAIRFQQDNHWDTVRRDCHRLAQLTRSKISSLTGLAPIQPDSEDWYAQMIASELPVDIDETQFKTKLYEQYKIEVPLVELKGQKFIRVSYQAYNQEADAHALINALDHLIPSR